MEGFAITKKLKVILIIIAYVLLALLTVIYLDSLTGEEEIEQNFISIELN